MAPSVSFSYYLSVLLPLVYLFLYTACVQDFDNFMHFKDFAQNTSAQIASILKTRVQRGVINGLTITCLIHWPIPWSILGISPVGGNSGNLSMVWTLSPVFLVLFLATLIFGDFKLKFGRSRV
jgi:hypothetical protein